MHAEQLVLRATAPRACMPWLLAPLPPSENVGPRSSASSSLRAARGASASASTQAEAAVGVFHGAREAPCSFPMHRHSCTMLCICMGSSSAARAPATTTTFSSRMHGRGEGECEGAGGVASLVAHQSVRTGGHERRIDPGIEYWRPDRSCARFPCFLPKLALTVKAHTEPAGRCVRAGRAALAKQACLPLPTDD